MASDTPPPGPRTDRPPKPPTRRCQHPGCIATPLYPGKDWSVFCGMHSGPLNERLAVWVERFRERTPGDEHDYGYNNALNDVARELRTPTSGSELAPIEAEARAGLDVERLARALPAVAQQMHWTFGVPEGTSWYAIAAAILAELERGRE